MQVTLHPSHLFVWINRRLTSLGARRQGDAKSKRPLLIASDWACNEASGVLGAAVASASSFPGGPMPSVAPHVLFAFILTSYSSLTSRSADPFFMYLDRGMFISRKPMSGSWLLSALARWRLRCAQASSLC